MLYGDRADCDQFPDCSINGFDIDAAFLGDGCPTGVTFRGFAVGESVEGAEYSYCCRRDVGVQHPFWDDGEVAICRYFHFIIFLLVSPKAVSLLVVTIPTFKHTPSLFVYAVFALLSF